MTEQDELILYMENNVKMGISSTTKLLRLLKDKDNKIKRVLENYLKDYELLFKEIKELKHKYKVKTSINKMMQKMMANTMMEEEVKHDNSDSKIANILIRGFTMGTIDIERHLKNFKPEVKDKKDIINLAEKLYDFSNKSIKELKDYL